MIDRRSFIGTTVAAGVGAALGSPGRAVAGPEGRAPAGPDGVPPAGTAPSAGVRFRVPPFELEEATVEELQRSMETGERTARSIVELYLERMEALNRRGPELRAVLEINPDALAIAEELDEERRTSGPRGPLHGIPVALKDNIDTHDRMTTTAGSLALEGSVPPRDAHIVARLREAGAILLAKLNMSEWAYFRGLRATSGWSARGGQCRNPYALDRNPCGSSSGSGVAASANLAALTVGTETGGSIMCPSSSNGVVGLKPTVGLWSRSGIIPISHSQDSAGPMCRTVRDAAILLGACAGTDPRDPATARAEGHVHTDYTRFLDPDGLRGARLGIARGFPGFDPRVLALFDRAVEAMRAGGAEIVDPVELEPAAWNDPLARVLLEYEFKAGLNAYLSSLGPDAPVRSLEEVIAFNERHAEREMPHFGQERMVAARARGPLTEPEYLRAKRTIQRATREEGIDRLVRRHRLDAIVAPTRGIPWLTDHILGDRLDGGGSAAPAAIAGYPDVSVPMGLVEGLPVGVSFFGPAWSEPTLLRMAHAYEQSTRERRKPTFAATLG